MTSARRFFSMQRTLPLRAIPLPKAALVMQEGTRFVVDGPDGPIVITKSGKEICAVDATCPHMTKYMGDGPIVTGPGGPELQCPFHNSKFCMKTGKCTKWVTGIGGAEITAVSGMLKKAGGQKQDITAYKLVTLEDGTPALEKK